MFTKGGVLSFFWRKLSPSANFHTKYICTNRDIMSASENLTKNTIWQIINYTFTGLGKVSLAHAGFRMRSSRVRVTKCAIGEIVSKD